MPSVLTTKLSDIKKQNAKIGLNDINGIIKDVIGLPDNPTATDWDKQKFEKLTYLILVCQIVSGQVDKTFNMSKLPTLHVPPPDGFGLAPGVDPEVIQDPVLRKDYENRIKANEAYASLLKEQVEIQRNQAKMLNYTERYIAHYFTKEEQKEVLNILKDRVPLLREKLLLHLATHQGSDRK